MAIHSKVRIYVHLIWGTYKHERILNRELRIKIFQHLIERANELKIVINKMNIQPEHVHMGIELPAAQSIAEVAKNFKEMFNSFITLDEYIDKVVGFIYKESVMMMSVLSKEDIKYELEKIPNHLQSYVFDSNIFLLYEDDVTVEKAVEILMCEFKENVNLCKDFTL